jgi:hypothetical protein
MTFFADAMAGAGRRGPVTDGGEGGVSPNRTMPPGSAAAAGKIKIEFILLKSCSFLGIGSAAVIDPVSVPLAGIAVVGRSQIRSCPDLGQRISLSHHSR